MRSWLLKKYIAGRKTMPTRMEITATMFLAIRYLSVYFLSRRTPEAINEIPARMIVQV